MNSKTQKHCKKMSTKHSNKNQNRYNVVIVCKLIKLALNLFIYRVYTYYTLYKRRFFSAFQCAMRLDFWQGKTNMTDYQCKLDGGMYRDMLVLCTVDHDSCFDHNRNVNTNRFHSCNLFDCVSLKWLMWFSSHKMKFFFKHFSIHAFF